VVVARVADTLLLVATWPLIETQEDLVEDPHLQLWVRSTAGWSLYSAHCRLHLRHDLTGTHADPVVAPLHILVLLLNPWCAGSFATWPLVGAHRRLPA
jgi:hypothetical protein